jgi:hypothetical protein
VNYRTILSKGSYNFALFRACRFVENQSHLNIKGQMNDIFSGSRLYRMLRAKPDMDSCVCGIRILIQALLYAIMIIAKSRILHFFFSVLNSVVDPDPAFQLNPDPDTDQDPVRIQGFDDQKLKKNTADFLYTVSFLIKNCHLLIPRPP